MNILQVPVLFATQTGSSVRKIRVSLCNQCGTCRSLIAMYVNIFKYFILASIDRFPRHKVTMKIFYSSSSQYDECRIMTQRFNISCFSRTWRLWWRDPHGSFYLGVQICPKSKRRVWVWCSWSLQENKVKKPGSYQTLLSDNNWLMLLFQEPYTSTSWTFIS